MTRNSRSIEALKRLHQASPDDVIIWAKLQVAQEITARKIKRRELAERMGITYNALDRLLTVDNRTKIENLQKILAALGLRFVARIEAKR